jgi:hypothetical protein
LVNRDGKPYNMPVTIEGQVVVGHIASDDLPHNHGTKDQYFFVHLDPPYRWLLADGNFKTGAGVERGRLEVEWEMEGDPSVYHPYAIAFPSWALPQQGDRVFVVGSHIFDCGHAPHRTEIHPPRLVVAYRNAAEGNFAGASNRLGWWFAFEENNGVPTLATRVDVFASSYGGEAIEEAYDNEDVNLSEKYPHDMGPEGNEQTWWQPIQDRDYTFTVTAPPKPSGEATLIHHIQYHLPAVGVVGVKPVLTPLPSMDGYSVTLPFSEVPLDVLYVICGVTIHVGWELPDPLQAFANVRHYRIDLKNIHIFNPLDDVTGTGEISVNACVNEQSVRLLSGSHTDSMGETYRSASTNSDFSASDLDKSTFFVSLVDGQPLRLSFRGVDYDPTENNELGTAEDIWIGDDTAWTDMDHTVYSTDHGVMGGEDCHEDCLELGIGCFSVTYRITRLHPPSSELSILSPKVLTSETTWVTGESNIILQPSFGPNGVGPLISIYRCWRIGQPIPAPTSCLNLCGFEIQSNDGADGPYTLQYWSRDEGSGALEPPHTVSLTLDNTPPTTTVSLSGTLTRGWYRTPVNVALDASDGPGVGVEGTAFALGGSPTTTYPAPFLVSTEGADQELSYRSIDKLGNEEEVKLTSFSIDLTLPSLSVTSAGDGSFTYTQEELVAGIFTNASTLNVSYAASDSLSGVFEVRLDQTASSTSSGTLVANLSAGTSMHTLEAEDVAGNVNSVSFPVVSIPPGTFAGGVDPQGRGFWQTAVTTGKYGVAQMADFLKCVNVASQGFGAKLNRWSEATLDNYLDYLGATPQATVDMRVRAELLLSWLNLVSGRLPAAAAVELKVPAWQTVVQNTAQSNQTTVLNVVREVERRLGESPSSDLLKTVRNILEKLHSGNI